MTHAIKRNAHKTTRSPTLSAAPPLPDIYQRITDQIVAAIEAGTEKWQMPWHLSAGENITRPINAVTGKPYRGVNILALWIAAQEKGYLSPEWATYKQWQQKGAQVRKGEQSSVVVFWKIGATETDGAEETREPQDEPTDAAHERRLVLARGYSVFNAAQVEGYTPPLPPTPSPTQTIERIERCESFFGALGADIRHEGNRAYYRPTTDHIQMPPFAAFVDAIHYYSTLGHEAIHWTAHPKRLARDLSGRFGSEAYAAEELVAELGAAFLCADLELTNTPRPDHAAYAATWVKVLKSDSHAIFTAASKAQQAIDYLNHFQEQPQAKSTHASATQYALPLV